MSKPVMFLEHVAEVDKTDGSASRRPTVHELDQLQWGHQLSGPSSLPQISTSSHPLHPKNAVLSTSSRHGEAVELTQTSLRRPSAAVVEPPLHENNTSNDCQSLPSFAYPHINRYRVLACCIGFFTQGLNDSVPGALVPHMQEYYHIGYAVVSMIFVANAVGFILAAPFVHVLQGKFGRAKVLSACSALNILAYTALICQPPFSVVVIAFLALGFAFGTILSLDNVFILSLINGTVWLGAMHGCYGIGGLVAPLIATSMISAGIRWSFFYFVSLGIQSTALVMFAWTFRGHETEPATLQLMNRDDQSITTANSVTATAATTTTAIEIEPITQQHPTTTTTKGVLRQSLRNKTTLLGALLIFAYQGAEVSISGWIISFLITYRHGDPTKVGYVTSGFWAGITLGRFLLVHPAQYIGVRISFIVLVVLSIAFQLLVWLVPNIVGNAVAVAIIGVLQGPVYPIASGTFATLIPRKLQMSSLGFIGSMGSSGGAVFPFVVGALAQKLGVVVLNPVAVLLYVGMVCVWVGLPKISRRME